MPKSSSYASFSVCKCIGVSKLHSDLDKDRLRGTWTRTDSEEEVPDSVYVELGILNHKLVTNTSTGSCKALSVVDDTTVIDKVDSTDSFGNDAAAPIGCVLQEVFLTAQGPDKATGTFTIEFNNLQALADGSSDTDGEASTIEQEITVQDSIISPSTEDWFAQSREPRTSSMKVVIRKKYYDGPIYTASPFVPSGNGWYTIAQKNSSAFTSIVFDALVTSLGGEFTQDYGASGFASDFTFELAAKSETRPSAMVLKIAQGTTFNLDTEMTNGVFNDEGSARATISSLTSPYPFMCWIQNCVTVSGYQPSSARDWVYETVGINISSLSWDAYSLVEWRRTFSWDTLPITAIASVDASDLGVSSRAHAASKARFTISTRGLI